MSAPKSAAIVPEENGGPAFPVLMNWKGGKPVQGAQTGNEEGWFPGMTLRQYYAGQAMVGIVNANIRLDISFNPAAFADQAVDIADALIAALKAGAK